MKWYNISRNHEIQMREWWNSQIIRIQNDIFLSYIWLIFDFDTIFYPHLFFIQKLGTNNTGLHSSHIQTQRAVFRMLSWTNWFIELVVQNMNSHQHYKNAFRRNKFLNTTNKFKYQLRSQTDWTYRINFKTITIIYQEENF